MRFREFVSPHFGYGQTFCDRVNWAASALKNAMHYRDMAHEHGGAK